MTPKFRGGPNVAIKVPSHQFDATVNFYRDVLGLEELPGDGDSVSFKFGANRLWIDSVANLSKSEIWLEVATDDAESASRYLSANGVSRRDEVEQLPEDVRGFWVSDSAGNIILVHEPENRYQTRQK